MDKISYFFVMLIICAILGVVAMIPIKPTIEPHGISIELSYQNGHVDVTSAGVVLYIGNEKRLIFDNSVKFPVISITNNHNINQINEIVPQNVSRLVYDLGVYKHYLVMDDKYQIYHASFEENELMFFSYVTSMMISNQINLNEN